MPNHCHNRVTFYSDDTTAILKLHKIFSKGLETNDNTEPTDTVFGSFIPEPDWSKVPLTENTVKEYSFSNLEVKSVSVLSSLRIRIDHLVVVYVLNQLTLWTIDGIIGVSKTGELSGIATP